MTQLVDVANGPSDAQPWTCRCIIMDLQMQRTLSRCCSAYCNLHKAILSNIKSITPPVLQVPDKWIEWDSYTDSAVEERSGADSKNAGNPEALADEQLRQQE